MIVPGTNSAASARLWHHQHGHVEARANHKEDQRPHLAQIDVEEVEGQKEQAQPDQDRGDDRRWAVV
jgi:hypothetical protein